MSADAVSRTDTCHERTFQTTFGISHRPTHKCIFAFHKDQIINEENHHYRRRPAQNVQHRLYALDYKGCMSCMACKIKGKASKVCKFKDALTPVLEDIANADGLVLGSPNYFGEVTGQMRAFLERLAFPWLSYNDYSITAPKRMPVVLVETQNGGVGGSNCNGYGSMEPCIARALGQPEKLFANNTYQVKNYANFELGGFSEEAKRKYRDEHWEEDLQKAFDAGKRMAETILNA